MSIVLNEVMRHLQDAENEFYRNLHSYSGFPSGYKITEWGRRYPEPPADLPPEVAEYFTKLRALADELRDKLIPLHEEAEAERLANRLYEEFTPEEIVAIFEKAGMVWDEDAEKWVRP
jgi:hypothetical protein